MSYEVRLVERPIFIEKEKPRSKINLEVREDNTPAGCLLISTHNAPRTIPGIPPKLCLKKKKKPEKDTDYTRMHSKP